MTSVREQIQPHWTAGDRSAHAPLFLVGSIRSGTTLLRLMLDAHPDIGFQHEAEFLFEYAEPDGAPPPLDRFHACLESNWVYRASGLRVDPDLEYRDAVRDLFWQKAVRDGNPICGATVHHHFRHIDRMFPDARFIHIIRDGRDVAASVVNQDVAGNLYVGAGVWLEALDEWRDLRSRLRDDQFIEVRFEDIVRDPERTLDRLCRWIGVERAPEMLRYHEHSTYGLPDARAAERWRRLPPGRLRPVERRIGDWLDALGYERANPLQRRPGPLFHAWQRADNLFRVARRRARRYGPSLYLQRQLVKLAPLPSFRGRVMARAHAVDQSLIK